MQLPKQCNTFLFCLCLLLAACSTTRTLPEGEKLYTGANVTLKADGATVRERKVLRSDLQGLTRPKPNARFLGIPFKLYIYNFFGKRKDDSFFGRLRNKYGEAPVLLSSVDINQNIKVLQNHLENKGFFKAQVTGDTVVTKKKGHANYKVDAGNQYKIKSVTYPSDSSDLTQNIQQSIPKSLLKPGDAYDLDVIKGERNRIDAFLKERGFYYFAPDYLVMRVDSTVGNNMVDIQVAVRAETPQEARTIYRINDVYIYSGYNLSTANIDTSKAYAKFYEGYYVIDRKNKFRPILFAQAMQFNPGEVYNRTDHNLSLNRLINLNEFKFVKNRFEPVADSAKLDAYYYLTPLPKKSLRAQLTATTKSNNLNGSEFSVNWRNRNTFRAGEQLSINAYVGTEVQFGGPWKGYNTYRSGAEANLSVPRFISPFLDIRTRGGYMPRTNFQLGYDILNRSQLYTLNSFRGGIGYLWKESLQKQHEFYPITINYIQPLNVTQKYRDSIKRYPYLERIIDSQFVIGSSYQYNYNDLVSGVQKVNSFYFSGLVDLSGNVAGLLVKADEDNQKRIAGAAFNQYIKLEADARFYRKLGLSSTWANRIIIGYGMPYGNSRQLPYIKQFFTGGNNSLRAFRSRTVGPGSYPLLSTNGFFPDQTGDIKLEFNTEFRPHISGPLYGAAFIDAGNIWLAREDPSRPGGKFSKSFLNELAIGTGVGIRLDITLFVIRLDLGIPIRRPWESNPWALNQIKFNSGAWRKENLILNLAIGYPF